MKDSLLVTFEIRASERIRVRDLQERLRATAAEDMADAVAELAMEADREPESVDVMVRCKVRRV